MHGLDGLDDVPTLICFRPAEGRSTSFLIDDLHIKANSSDLTRHDEVRSKRLRTEVVIKLKDLGSEEIVKESPLQDPGIHTSMCRLMFSEMRSRGPEQVNIALDKFSNDL